MIKTKILDETKTHWRTTGTRGTPAYEYRQEVQP